MRGALVSKQPRVVASLFLNAFEGVDAGGGADAVDVAVVEVFQAGSEPFVFVVPEHEFKGPGKAVKVLAGVEQVHDLRGLGEFRGGDVPDPGGAVAEDGHLADVAGTAADAFCLHQAGEHGGGLEGGNIAGGVPVADRVFLVVELAWVKKTASLTSRVRARPSSPLPSRPAVSFAVTGTPVPSIAAYSLSGSGDGGLGTSLRAVIMAARPRTAAAAAVPLASAARATRLTVRRTPARFSSSRAAFAHVPAAAASSFIARSPGDKDAPATPSPGIPGGWPVPAGRAVIPGARQGHRPEHRVDHLVPVGDELCLMSLAAQHGTRGPR